MGEETRNQDSPAEPSLPQSDASPSPKSVAARLDRADWLSFLITTALAFVVYWFTLAPDVTLEWSGMLSTSAMYGGVSPPAGYPVWTIYSWFFIKLLPFSNIAWRVTVGSAVAAALASGVLALIVSHSGRKLFDGTPAFSRLRTHDQSLLRASCGYVSGLSLGLSGGVWGEAVIADIWSLSLLLFVCVVCLLMRWMFEPGRRGFLYAAFLLFGILLTNSQHMIAALPGFVCALMLEDRKLGRHAAFVVLPAAAAVATLHQYGLWIDFPHLPDWPLLVAFIAILLIGGVLTVITRRVALEWKAAIACGFFLLLGLVPDLYLPIASMTNPPVNWGYPRTMEGFLHVLGRGQYEKLNPTRDWGRFAEQLWGFLKMTGEDFGWPYLALALLGFFYLCGAKRTGRMWMLGMVVIWICCGPLLLALLNPPPDRGAWELIELYFPPSYVILALWAGFGLMLLGGKVLKAAEEKSP